MKSIILAAIACFGLAVPVAGQATEPVANQVFSKVIPNIPGKSLTVLEVSYTPGGKSAPHHHAGTAFVYGYVLSGVIRTQVEGGPIRTLKAGDSFYELPGDHHVLGENASQTESARFLVVFVVDTQDQTLTIPDK